MSSEGERMTGGKRDVRALLLGPIERVVWLAPLIGRLAVGLMFASTGWGKVHSLDEVTGFFESLGIPWPGFNAALVGYSELCCGVLLVVGLLTRLAAIPLMVVMCVALLTARAGDIGGLLELAGANEFTYLCVLAIVALLGP
jgi:putative oxidoreductase